MVNWSFRSSGVSPKIKPIAVAAAFSLSLSLEWMALDTLLGRDSSVSIFTWSSPRGSKVLEDDIAWLKPPLRVVISQNYASLTRLRSSLGTLFEDKTASRRRKFSRYFYERFFIAKIKKQKSPQTVRKNIFLPPFEGEFFSSGGGAFYLSSTRDPERELKNLRIMAPTRTYGHSCQAHVRDEIAPPRAGGGSSLSPPTPTFLRYTVNGCRWTLGLEPGAKFASLTRELRGTTALFREGIVFRAKMNWDGCRSCCRLWIQWTCE